MAHKDTGLAAEQWLDEYGYYLYRFALARVNRPQIAEDLVQETLLSALKGQKEFKQRSSVRTWLTSILRNKIIDYYRKNANRSEQSWTGNDDEDSDPAFDDHGRWIPERAPQDWGEQPEKLFGQQEFLRVLKACLKLLAGLSARVFTLREIDGWESEMICRELAITPSNLWVLLHRARKSLRGCLEKAWLR